MAGFTVLQKYVSNSQVKFEESLKRGEEINHLLKMKVVGVGVVSKTIWKTERVICEPKMSAAGQVIGLDL